MGELYNIKFKLTKSDHIEATKYIRKRILGKSRWRFVNLMLGSISGFTLMATIISIVSFYENHSGADLTDLNIGLTALFLSVIIFFITSFLTAFVRRCDSNMSIIFLPV